MSTLDPRPIEKAKIRCARKVFNETSTEDVRYCEVANCQMMKDVIEGMEQRMPSQTPSRHAVIS